MTRVMLFSATLLVLLTEAAVGDTVSLTVENPGFESPTWDNVSWIYTNPWASGHALPELTSVPGWTFGPSGGDSYDGLAAINKSDVNCGYPADWTGQMAFLEGTGSFSQVINGFAAGTSSITFQAAGRNLVISGTDYGSNGVRVLFDGAPLSFTGGAQSITPVNGVMGSYTAIALNVTAGAHTVTFQGTIPISSGDHSTYVDNIGVTSSAVPEPSAIVVMAMGLIGLLAYAWRKRR